MGLNGSRKCHSRPGWPNRCGSPRDQSVESYSVEAAWPSAWRTAPGVVWTWEGQWGHLLGVPSRGRTAAPPRRGPQTAVSQQTVPHTAARWSLDTATHGSTEVGAYSSYQLGGSVAWKECVYDSRVAPPPLLRYTHFCSSYDVYATCNLSWLNPVLIFSWDSISILFCKLLAWIYMCAVSYAQCALFI